MAQIHKYVEGLTVTLISTDLNSLASSATAGAITGGVSPTVFNNVAGGGGLDGYTLGKFEVVLAAPAGTLTAPTIQIYFLKEVDGTDYEDGSATIIPARPPDVTLQARLVSGAQRFTQVGYLPSGTWLCLVSQSTGQTWNASGNSIKVQPLTDQAV